MRMLINNGTTPFLCKFCLESKEKFKSYHDSETQTSPIRNCEDFEITKGNNRPPCARNLLCSKGFHEGRCTSASRGTVCANWEQCKDCPCHQGNSSAFRCFFDNKFLILYIVFEIVHSLTYKNIWCGPLTTFRQHTQFMKSLLFI